MKNHPLKSTFLAVIFSFFLISQARSTQPSITNTIGDRVLETNASSFSINLPDYIKVDDATNLVRVTTTLKASNGAALGFTLRLFPTNSPKTVANFLAYVNDGAYENMLIHRSVPGFVIQTGGYGYSGTPIGTWTNTVPSEASNGLSNVRGTVAMALVGSDSNSATDQWFINLSDNSSILDRTNTAGNPPFTVFAQVIDNGMSVADAIAGLRITNLGGAFSQLPLLSTNTTNPLALTNLVHISRVATIPYFALSSDPNSYYPRISNSILTIEYTGETNPPSNPVTISIYATDTNGLTTNTSFKVWNKTNAEPKVPYISEIISTNDSIFRHLFLPQLPDGTPITNVVFSWSPSTLIDRNKNYAISGTGTITLTAISQPTLFYQGTTNVFAIKIAHPQTITFPPFSTNVPFNTNAYSTINFTTNAIPLKGFSDSRLPLTYSTKGCPCRISGTNLFLTGTGTLSVTAVQEGNSEYFAALPVTNTVVVAPTPQTITFPPIPNQDFLKPVPVPLKAYSSSGLPVTYRIVSGTATITNGNLIQIGIGTIVVAADQQGFGGYLPATSVTNIFEDKFPQTLTPFSSIPPKLTYTYPLSTLSIKVPTTTTQSLTNVIVTVTGPATITNNSLVTITGAGTVKLTATQAGNDRFYPVSVSTSIAVAKASQKLFGFVGVPKKTTNGIAPFTIAIPASDSPLPVRVTATGAGYISATNQSQFTVTLTGAGPLTLSAEQAGNSNYIASTPVKTSIVVAKGNQSIVFPQISSQQVGKPVVLSAYTTNSSGMPTGLPISYSISSSPRNIGILSGNQINPIGAGTITAIASQAGSSGYNPARSITKTFIVTP